MVAAATRSKRRQMIAMITASYLLVDEILRQIEREDSVDASYQSGLARAAVRDLFYLRMESLDAATFRAMFRMNRFALEILRNGLAPFLAPQLHPKLFGSSRFHHGCLRAKFEMSGTERFSNFSSFARKIEKTRRYSKFLLNSGFLFDSAKKVIVRKMSMMTGDDAMTVLAF